MIFLLFAFLLGSVPFGLLVGRVFHAGDVRKQGSGNIGATNVTRVAGLRAGLTVFVLDLIKGAIPAFLGGFEPLWTLMEKAPQLAAPLHAGTAAAWAGGLFAVLGHCFSPWLKLKGGKGVATGFGAILVLAPIPALVGFVMAFLIFLNRRMVSISCIGGIAVAAVTCVLLGPVEPSLFFGAVMIAVILFRHEENIDALLEGRERRFRS